MWQCVLRNVSPASNVSGAICDAEERGTPWELFVWLVVETAIELHIHKLLLRALGLPKGDCSHLICVKGHGYFTKY